MLTKYYTWKEFQNLPEIKDRDPQQKWMIYNDYLVWYASISGSNRCRTTYVICDYVFDDYVE